MYGLSKDGYKAIDRSWYDDLYGTVEFSNDGHWAAFSKNGFFYIYNYKSQELYNLPGTDWIEGNCTFQYTNDNSKLYGGGRTKWFSWDITNHKSIRDNLVDSLNRMEKGESWDYENFYSFRFPNTYLYHDIMNSYCWENGDSIIFPEINGESEQHEDITYFNYRQSNGSEVIKKLPKANALGKDFVVNPSIPEICYLADNDISIWDLKKDIYYTVPIHKQFDYYNKCYYLQTGKELMVNSNLYSNRNCKAITPLVISDLQELSSYHPNLCSNSIKYNDKELYLCDIHTQSNLKLYICPNNEDEGYPDLYLFTKGNPSPKFFTPFVAFSTSNGISYFQNAFILNDNEILCISGQDQHIIYDIKTGNRYEFEICELNSILNFAHADIPIMKSIISQNRDILYTISCGGILSIFDIKSHKLIYEFAIPKLFINSSNTTETDFDLYTFSLSRDERITDLIIEENKNRIKIIYELNYKYFSYYIQLPSIQNIVDHAIQQLNSFWD